MSFHDAAKDPPQGLGGNLARLASKYIWWKKSDDPSLTSRRVLAQIMDIGTFEDAQCVAAEVGDDALRDVLANADAGWFTPRSWAYWPTIWELSNPVTIFQHCRVANFERVSTRRVTQSYDILR